MVDAICSCDGLLNRGGDEAAYKFSIGADIGGLNGYFCIFIERVLAYSKRALLAAQR